jgi:uncharacterized protein (TIGR00299 family) protein
LGKTAYFDCFSGVSGDMFLGALLDAGLPLDALRAALGSLAMDVGAISSDRVLRAGVSAAKFRAAASRVNHAADQASTESQADRDHGHTHAHHHTSGGAGARPVHHHHHAHVSLKDIAGAIARSALSRAGQDRALSVFQRLAEAEAAIHNAPLENVHLHEVGALDSIVDIVGAVYGMEWLGADEIAASPLNLGGGTVECEHGTFPVPAPATARLLRDVPVYGSAIPAELVTPTGAALITEYAQSFGPIPAMRIHAIGYGAGDREFMRHPNVLRLLVGERENAGSPERIVVMECEIDDMNPQLFGPLMDRVYASGALDIFYAPVQMKKNRPGTLVTVLARPEHREAVTAVLFAETTTIGVRYQEVQRERLDRETRTVETPVGPIRFKIAARDGRVLNAAPEFDDCVAAAAAHGLSIKDVQAIASKAWLDRL